MKKLFLLGTFALLLSTSLFSCTADELDTVEKVKPATSADAPGEGGGQNGQTTTTPPKP
jgi:hypothetical protein